MFVFKCFSSSGTVCAACRYGARGTPLSLAVAAWWVWFPPVKADRYIIPTRNKKTKPASTAVALHDDVVFRDRDLLVQKPNVPTARGDLER